MAKPSLTLVRPEEIRRAEALRSWRTALLAAALVAAAVVATLSGADRVRESFDPHETAAQALETSLERGNEDEEVHALLELMRENLSLRPLDSRTRATYAGLLLGVCRRFSDTRAALFHARVAAELAPVTVPIVRTSTRVLFRAGEIDEALELMRRMFGFDASAAARLLTEHERVLTDAQIEQTVPSTPDAVMAWSYNLRMRGQMDEADRWIDRGNRLWPDHLQLLWQAAERAFVRRDSERLDQIFASTQSLPDRPEAALVLPYRARHRFGHGDAAGAQADLARALELGGENPTVIILCGNTFEAMGEFGEARALWSQALFRLPDNAVDARRSVLLSLARGEDTHGSPGQALRRWRAVLELDPEHSEARRRVDDLTGFRR